MCDLNNDENNLEFDDQAEPIGGGDDFDFDDQCTNPLDLTSKCQEGIEWLNRQQGFNKKSNEVMSFLVKNIVHIDPKKVGRISNLKDCGILDLDLFKVYFYNPKSRTKRAKEGFLEIVPGSTAVIVCYEVEKAQAQQDTQYRNGLNFGGQPAFHKGTRIRRGRNLIKGISARMGELLNSPEQIKVNIQEHLQSRSSLQDRLALLEGIISDEGAGDKRGAEEEEVDSNNVDSTTKQRRTRPKVSRGRSKGKSPPALEELVQQCLELYLRYFETENDQTLNKEIADTLNNVRIHYPAVLRRGNSSLASEGDSD